MPRVLICRLKIERRRSHCCSEFRKATELIIKNPDIFKDYEVIKGKMDDVFMAVTGKNLSGGDVK